MMPMQPDMPQHDDETQDIDMIKQVLQKIIDQMDQMEADKHLPDHMKPKAVAADIHMEGSPMEEASESPEEESDEDHSMLPDLMDKAKDADDEGSLPEDKQDDVDPAIAAIVAEKKKLLPK